ncbi:hypothetical protein SEA_DULCIE_91 [Mycobacterium phage Dulcie]|nr:hypothetical protein SEA_DULCIE_91 [Mycobacterium phage Dulcie]
MSTVRSRSVRGPIASCGRQPHPRPPRGAHRRSVRPRSVAQRCSSSHVLDVDAADLVGAELGAEPEHLILLARERRLIERDRVSRRDPAGGGDDRRGGEQEQAGGDAAGDGGHWCLLRVVDG